MARRISEDEEEEDEVKENIQQGITEVIGNPSRTRALFIDLIKSAKVEILLILPTVNAFLNIELEQYTYSRNYLWVRCKI